MSRLSQTEYTRRHRAKQKAELDSLRISVQTLGRELEQAQTELRMAYFNLDLLEAALTRVLGRPVA